MSTSFEDLEYLFVDTDTFLSREERNVIDALKARGGFEYILRMGEGKFAITEERNVMFALVKKGLLRLFSLSDSVYIYAKDLPNCRPISVEFNAYFASVGRTATGTTKILDQDERDKIAYGRGFIAKWIFKKDKISDMEHIQFLTVFTSRASYAISIPEFLFKTFTDEIDKTGMSYNILSPSYKTTHCPYCNTDFDVRDEFDTAKCPNCEADVLVR